LLFAWQANQYKRVKNIHENRREKKGEKNTSRGKREEREAEGNSSKKITNTLLSSPSHSSPPPRHARARERERDLTSARAPAGDGNNGRTTGRSAGGQATQRSRRSNDRTSIIKVVAS